MAACSLVPGFLGPTRLSAAVIDHEIRVPTRVRGRPAIDGGVAGPVGDILRGRAVQKSGPTADVAFGGKDGRARTCAARRSAASTHPAAGTGRRDRPPMREKEEDDVR